jgi:hypothetical protein
MHNASTMNKYSRLSIRLSERALAKEVASEMEIEIQFKNPPWLSDVGAEDGDYLIGVYCETKEKAEQFGRAFSLRRWEDSKSLQSE